MIRLGLVALGAAALALGPVAVARAADPVGMVRIPAGSYRPLYRPAAADSSAATRSAARRATPRIAVATFMIDVRPVTNAQYLAFVRAHPKWRRSRVDRLFADAAYLRHWESDLSLGPDAPPESPVVNVSWFAARAYLAAHGRRLPSVDQWEYVAAANETSLDASRDRATLERLRGWYARPSPARLPAVGGSPANRYGVQDLHGLIWEWTLDFNSALVTGESRGDASLERALYCGSGAAGASDFEDYAALMRFAHRSSLEARYCLAGLGFRGVALERGGTR